MGDRRRRSRIRRFLHDRPWFTSVLNAIAGLAFVAGCVLFYSATTYNAGVTLFLIGSVVMTASVALDAYVRFGPAADAERSRR